jgi:hypothetical protein
MRTWAPLLGTAALLVFPAAAAAHRKATRAEKAAMVYHAGSHYGHLTAKQVDEPKNYPLKCAEADIATVVKGSTWGAWAPNSRTYHERACKRWAFNAWVIEHKIRGRWYVIAEGDLLPYHVPHVPHRIAKDLITGLP